MSAFLATLAPHRRFQLAEVEGIPSRMQTPVVEETDPVPQQPLDIVVRRVEGRWR